MNNKHKILAKQFKELSDFITSQQKSLDDVTNKEVVLFIGPAGVGKSTIISYLLGVPLVYEKVNGCRIVNVRSDM
jgi:putative ribosome biogenesis GTPase RsgA